MPDFSDRLRETLAALATKVGLKPSDADKLASLRARVIERRAANLYQVDKLKAEIQVLEARALRKHAEFNETRGAGRHVVQGEIERTFRELDAKAGTRSILERNLAQADEVLAKLAEIEMASLRGATADEMDDIALDAATAFDDLREDDRAHKSLQGETYAAPEQARVDIESRVADATPLAAKEAGGKAQAPSLPDDLARRLKELEPG